VLARANGEIEAARRLLADLHAEREIFGGLLGSLVQHALEATTEIPLGGARRRVPRDSKRFRRCSPR
jgi:hypothetical protein